MASEIRVNQIQNRSGLTTTTFTDTGVTISGILTVSDDLNVGGVLTYEDVTNIDAVGVLTARAGINLVGNDLNVGSNIKIGNASGIVTATSFSGSGANLTSLPAQATIANNADNRVITGGSGVNLNGEANLLFDGGTLALNGRYQRGSATVQDGDAIAGGININGLDMDASVIMSVFGNDGDFTRISGSKSRNASVGSHTIVQNNDVLLSLKGFGSDGTNFEEAAQIEMQVDGSPGNNVMPGRIVFKTATTDGVVERLRITSDGKIGINNDSPVYALHMKNAMSSSPSYIHMQATGSNVNGGGGGISFDTSAANTNETLYKATIAGIRNTQGNGSNDLVFSTSDQAINGAAPTEKLRISSEGYVTKPSQPSFAARSTGTWSHGSSTGYLDIDISMIEVFDIGGNYNHSTGVFTAPVAGKYFFAYTFQYKCTSGYIVVTLRKGVSGSYSQYGNMVVYPPQQSTIYTGPGIIGIMDLAAGNTVRPNAEVNYAGNQIANVNFSGYLLG